jgi:hypothetical protein
MNAARETTTPMSHGLTSGVPLAFSVEIVAAVLLMDVSFPASLNAGDTYVENRQIQLLIYP